MEILCTTAFVGDVEEKLQPVKKLQRLGHELADIEHRVWE